MDYITAALGAGRAARKTGSEAVILRGPGARGHRVLVNSSGELTALGTLLEQHTGETLPRGELDVSQDALREGSEETIKVRGGARKVVRRFMPDANAGAGKWRYTSLGKAFFRNRRVSYIVRVPARFTGTRASGLAYTRYGFFPIANPVQVPLAATQAQRDAMIKQAVLYLMSTTVCWRSAAKR